VLKDALANAERGAHKSFSANSQGHVIHAVGWKNEDVELFVATCGTTIAGDTEQVILCDDAKVCQVQIHRPQIVADFRSGASRIDFHDQLRQGYLHWEKNCFTHSGFFRIITTIFAMVVTDTMMVASALHPQSFSGYTIVEFAGVLARAMLIEAIPNSSPPQPPSSQKMCELRPNPKKRSLTHPDQLLPIEATCDWCATHSAGEGHRSTYHCSNCNVVLCTPMSEGNRQCFAQHVYARFAREHSSPADQRVSSK
jgi:hypothetical protein